MYILNVIKNILATLDKETKRKYIGLQLIFFGSAFFQVVGIASIGPFISILSDPEIIHENAALSYVYEALGFENDIQFMFFAAAGSLVLILLSNLVAGYTIWISYKFSIMLGSQLQQNAYRNFLHLDYLRHKTENYNRKIAVISQQIPRFVYMLFKPFLLLTSQLFVAALILIGLLILDPLLAIISATVIGGSYLATYVYLRKKLARHGAVVSERNNRVQSILSESFIGIKDVKLDSIENKYITEFNSINVKGLRSQAFIGLSGELPKFIIESISFGAILLLAVVLLMTQDSIKSVVPILSIYALAGYKLLPTMQQIYKSISSLSGHGSVAALIRNNVNVSGNEDIAPAPVSSIKIDRVTLEDANFSYPGSDQVAIDNVTLALQKGQIYSLVGQSGSGKSTLADIILGLIRLDSGALYVNDTTVTADNIAQFRKRLGYVAQNIFILEDTVAKNVAFGVPDHEIDMDRVHHALTMANAWEFVETLPKGIHTNLGQDGKLLSGGQRQRIGIARALYKQTDVLVLDEPTSALDIESEYKLMKTLDSIKKDLIVLIISHRPTAIQMSDTIVHMRSGSLTAVDSYDNLIATDGDFKKMMEISASEEASDVG
ncbi:ABC transporter ATP-binding protein [Marinobacter nanhaiticus D15-8W]|uniref:ABC transporter ATP-binding protein n=1 Tax=Marinobacter nanhaiticus D15-8W TaxID=626887 RepID=N6W2F8_9GAMM|nr:ABC transporter ATP-binding protein [Marinobacter nanhaiticus]ENO14294.1 ABC transporter ATP-binding protein [Marinobacter nanhaiticus D15-8W]BES71681.1 ABC transporter ATP-binding protein [Marinobacter nanhaiticus D15-8W]